MKTCFILLPLVVACGNSGASDIGSCTSAAGAPQPACFEYTDATMDELDLDAEPRCTDSHGLWAFARCTRQGVIAGCRLKITGPHGSYMDTIWYYTGDRIRTTDDVMMTCSSLGGDFVAP
jgi:hypothetical protein